MERCRCFDCKNSGEVYHPDYKFRLELEDKFIGGQSNCLLLSSPNAVDHASTQCLVSTDAVLSSPKASLLDLASMCENRPEL